MLTVIAIILILFGIVTVIVSGVLNRGKDTRRAKEVASLDRAVKLYHSQNLHYPDEVPLTSSCDDKGQWEKFLAEIGEEGSSIKDPENKEPYCYYYVNLEAWGEMEGISDGIDKGSCGDKDLADIDYFLFFVTENIIPDNKLILEERFMSDLLDLLEEGITNPCLKENSQCYCFSN